MIKIINLQKRFGFNEVLKNINLSLNKGQVYGIIGENGAGKTTLFRCIADLDNYEGEIYSEINPLKDHLGILFTEPFFFTKITGKEHIRLLCNARKKVAVDIDDKNIFDLPLDDYVSTYSTGMKKKLALLAILMQENDFYLLDEPFNGIDIHSSLIVIEIIKKLKSLEKTVFIASHIFSTMRETCDEIYVLNKGEIIRTVLPNEFTAFENEMKEFAIGNKINRLCL